MADDDRTQPDEDKPTLRQRLHAATGDRDAEARALADRAGEGVSESDAKDAVQRAHGDSGAADSPIEHDLASAEEAKTAGAGPT
jgi:hypothetical protein